MSRLFASIVFLWATALLAGCGGGGSGDQGTGVLSVQVTDAKVDEALAVVLHYTDVTIHGESGNTVVEILDPDPLTGLPGRSINLLNYTNGVSTVLFEQELPAGNYSWMRLKLDFDNSHIQLADGPHPLRCTSCENNGIKLNRSFTIEADQTTAFTLDFDLRSSITYANEEHHIRPTIRVVATAASGAIEGSVDPTLIASLGSDGTGCAVYVFTGENAQVDDIYLPMTDPVLDTQNNPITTAVVDSNLHYTAGFLPAGMYTVSLTCDAAADDPAVENVLTFTGTTNAQVDPGEPYTVDFDGT